MARPLFYRSGAKPASESLATPAGPSPLLGLAMLAMAGLLAFWIVGGGIPSPGPGPGPGPGPNPNPDVVLDDYAEASEIAGKLEDRLYADAYLKLADETEAGQYETAEAWHAAAGKRMYDARFKAQEQVHRALNQIFPKGNVDDFAAAAASLREIAKGFQRSGE